MNFSWKLRKYRDGDERAIFELLNKASGKWHDLEYWRWKFKKNPAGSSIIWLAEHNNKVIGHYGIIPIRMKVGNIYITGSFGCDAATHPKYQGKGIFSSLVNRCYLDVAENNIPLTYGFANPNLGPTYKRYEWRGHICFMINMIKVLNWKPLLNKYINNKFLASTAAHLLGKNIRRPRPTNEGVRFERISRFDEKINKFWGEISKHFEIIVKRDQRYLNWRYVDHPEHEYIIYAAIKDKKILGYCVLSKRQIANLKFGLIVDILGFQDNRNVVGHLIQRAIKYFEERNIDVISCMLSEQNPYKATLRKAGFITIPRNIFSAAIYLFFLRCHGFITFSERDRMASARLAAIHATINLRGSSINEKEAYSQALILSQNYFFKEKRNWFMMNGDGDGV